VPLDIINLLIESAAQMLPSPQALGLPCYACGEPAEHRCVCDRPVCHRHSYDTDGNLCKWGMCEDCVDMATL